MRDRSSFVRHLALVLFVLGLASAAAGGAPTYRLDVQVDAPAGSYSGTLAMQFENSTSASLTEVFFRLYPNSAGLYGAARLDVTAASVAGVAVETALFVDDTVLFIPLATPLEPGDEVAIELSFSGRAALASPAFATPTEYGVLTRSRDVLTFTAFYPVLAPCRSEGWAIDPLPPFGDPLFADAATYEVSIVVAADAVPVPVPDATAPESDGRVRLTYSRSSMRDFPLAFLAAGRRPLEAQVGDVALRCWFSDEHGEAAQVALERATAALDVFSALFGTLPYGSLDIVEAPLQRAAGVEASGLFFVASGNAANPHDPFFDVIVSHETAHQWFYASVGSDPIEEPWLDESLATYASNVFLTLAVSEAASAAQRAAWSAAYSRALQSHPDLAVTSSVWDFPNSETYASFVYSGGALELEALQSDLGDEAFFVALRRFAELHQAGIATGEDFCRIVDEERRGTTSVLCSGKASGAP